MWCYEQCLHQVHRNFFMQGKIQEEFLPTVGKVIGKIIFELLQLYLNEMRQLKIGSDRSSTHCKEYIRYIIVTYFCLYWCKLHCSSLPARIVLEFIDKFIIILLILINLKWAKKNMLNCMYWILIQQCGNVRIGVKFIM